jgi:pimeloyl-ACP methyl ester carboxylesterase
MEREFFDTEIGEIAVYQKNKETNKTPIIFLHGVYFDHQLWDNQINSIFDRPIIALDMPLHGASKNNIKKNWNLDDCAEMLLEILDRLKIEKVFAIGHSWGSMTILRAANINPQKFSALGLCNMPFRESSKSEKMAIKLQETGLLFKKFYMKQAGYALMTKESRSKNPALLNHLLLPMNKLSRNEIKYTNKAVRIDAKDASKLIKKLEVPAYALVGKKDYVGIPPEIETFVVQGGHVSPIEAPIEVNQMIVKIMAHT